MIDTESIRIKVLELAMRGRLSEQRIEDRKSVPEHNLLTELTKEERPYKIPRNWVWVKVKDIILKDVGGGTPSKSVPEYWNGGTIPWVTVKDFSGAEFGYLKDTIDHITQEGLDNSASNMVDEDAIIICMRMALGKIVRVARPMAINQDLRAIWLKEYVLEDYFVYFYSTLKVEGRGMTVSGIRKDELMNYAFPIPPIREQERIVKKVDEIFKQLNVIDELQSRYLSDVKVLKSKLIDAGIQGKLTEQFPEDGTAEDLYAEIQAEKTKLIEEGKIKKEKILPEITEDEIPFDIPQNWKWVRWGDISQSIQYGYNAPAKETGRIKMVRISDIQNNKVLWDSVPYCDIEEENIKTYLLHENDILFARTGGTVGKSYIVSEIPEEAIYAGYLIRTSYSTRFCAKYIKYFMESRLYWKQLQNGTIATAQPNCNGQTLSKMMLPLPPVNEQHQIVNRINEAFSIINKSDIYDEQ